MTNDKPRLDPLSEAAFARRLGLAILSVLQHKGVVTDLEVETILAVAQQAVRDGAVQGVAQDGVARDGAARDGAPEAPHDGSSREGVPHIDMEL